MRIRHIVLQIFIPSLFFLIPFYYQTTDFVLKEYIPRSCAHSTLEVARHSCGEYPQELAYAENTLKVLLPLVIASGAVYALASIFERIVRKKNSTYELSQK